MDDPILLNQTSGATLNQRKNEEKCFGLWATFEPIGFDSRKPILCGPDCSLIGKHLT